MTQAGENIVQLGATPGILGVVESQPLDAPQGDDVSPIHRENIDIVQAYAAQLGQSALQADVQEAFQTTDPDALSENRDVTPPALIAALSCAGLDGKVLHHQPARAAPWPAIALMTNGQYVLAKAADAGAVTLHDVSAADGAQTVPLAEFTPYFSGTVVKAEASIATLKDTHIAAAPKGHWFWSELLKHKMRSADVIVGSLVANVLAVAVALFSLQVYDRVIPHESTPTLWVLAIGAFLAIALEGLLKISRSRLMDGTGRSVELTVQNILMRRLLGLRTDTRPMAPSSLFAAVREFSAVREFFTASAIGSILDLPFIVLFLLLVASIGGPIVWVLVAGGVLMVLPGYFLQKRMMALTRDAQGTSAKSGRILQEVIFDLETIKSQRGEARFERIWAELCGLTAVTSAQQRRLASNLTFWSQGVQQATYVCAVIMGAFMVFAGELTVGSIIAIGILTGRTLGPLSQLSGVMARWSNVKTALEGLDTLIDAPQDMEDGRSYLRRETIAGDFEIRDLKFRYDKDTAPALDITGVGMKAGEVAAVLGVNGSGKSTLLKVMAGLLRTDTGRVMLDGVDIAQINPRDVRRAVGYLGQDVRLVAGTLRDNLNLSGLERSDSRMLDALDFAGLGPFVRGHAKGLDMQIRDGGEGLSSGQRQSVGWARLWLQNPSVVLLDEPTAALDQTLEAALISRLETWLGGKTALIATHRMPILSLTSRTFILQAGRLAVDGPRDAVIAHLTRNKKA